ncbi:MAG: CDP-diacylglycerol--serine O-phosphatidyltransferase [Tannerellaceae bacterium]|jgi:CDP-diacylglycerol--serine O-phosphatidyltransferase|nr:CDP-diacylglycerol--serine O-phosphatidyltransferase [Tannerellaceae bacterium]
MNIRKHIPNFITCLSLLSGCAAVVTALDGYIRVAMICIMAAAVFDFLDGLFARLLHAYSAIGKELDSLSDMVAFGLAPAMIIFFVLGEASPALHLGAANAFVPFLAFVIPVFSALRLAKFNVDTRQTDSFIGLPVPAHALLWSSLGYALQPLVQVNEVMFALLTVLSVALTSWLLVSEIPMFSLKTRSLGWKGNEIRYILLGGSAGFIVFFGFLGIAASIVLYIMLSVLNTICSNSKITSCHD